MALLQILGEVGGEVEHIVAVYVGNNRGDFHFLRADFGVGKDVDKIGVGLHPEGAPVLGIGNGEDRPCVLLVGMSDGAGIIGKHLFMGRENLLGEFVHLAVHAP